MTDQCAECQHLRAQLATAKADAERVRGDGPYNPPVSQDRFAEWVKAANFLFGLLDDIDTVSDMAKGNDKAYREHVEHIQRRRFEVATTDGYSVTFKHDKPPTQSSKAALATGKGEG